MRHIDPAADAPAPSRADLDIELARLALRLGRATSHVMQGAAGLAPGERRAALRDWFATVSDGLVNRAHPKYRAYARARVQRLASSCSALALPAPGAGTRGSAAQTLRRPAAPDEHRFH